ncbi:MAG: FAD-binding oxidoreductase [Planctomycetes bacterium]|nr:FAD-binding oxidoreductase [Planctomycetota bacterium]
MPSPDFLIVGGGIAGAATAWFLAQRGAGSVLVLDREAELGAHSTAKNAGILRTWIAEPSTRELAQESLRFLAAPPAGFSEVPLFDACGLVLEIQDEQRAAFDAWVARRVGGAEPLDEVAFRARLPHVAWRPGNWFLIPDDGRLDAAAIHASFVSGARRAGAEFRTGAGVRELLVRDGAVRGVRLDDGTELHAGRTVMAAGGWAGKLARAAGSPLVLHPRRRHLLVTAIDASIDTHWPVIWSDREKYYARPESGGMMICACDETEVDPDDCRVDDAVLDMIAARAETHLPSFADAGAAHYWCGMRTFADDPRFVIGDDPELAGLFWVAGLGGHGMTCSAAVGRLAADLLTGSDGGPIAKAVDPRRLVEDRTSAART